jgi:uncharacterized membrane protein
MKKITKAKICVVLGLVVFIVLCIRVPGLAQYSADKGTEALKVGVDGLVNLLDSETSSNEIIETSDNPTNVVNVPSTDTVDKEPETSNKGMQEHNNAGIQVTLSEPFATTVWVTSIVLIIVIIAIGAIIIFIGKSRNIGSSFSLNN